MSRAVSGRRSAIRNATSESWRISLSVSCDMRPLPSLAAWERPQTHSKYGTCGFSGRDLGAVEMLVRGAVIAFRQRRPLARLALPRRRVAVGHAALECAGLDLLLDEL